MSKKEYLRGPLGTQVFKIEVTHPDTLATFDNWVDKNYIGHRLKLHRFDPTYADERVIVRGTCSERAGEQLQEAEREMPGVTVFVEPRIKPNRKSYPLPDSGIEIPGA